MNSCYEILQKYWGYSSFRPLQEEIIQSVLAGKDTLGLMPTGGGKSLTFQVPAMVKSGLCLVVTPLIALMKDQIDNLKQRGIKALAIYSGMTYSEILVTLENAVLGDSKFLYVSPERLSTDLFLAKLKSMQVSFLVVDEAHCISQWGYDFRPSYMSIVSIREYLPHVPVLALTATATKKVVQDIQKNLQFKENNVFKVSFERSNLAYLVHETENKYGSLYKILQKKQGSAIVYVRSRQQTKEIARDLTTNGFSADFYHAGLNDSEKTQKQNAWKNDECRIMVSTNAFGMGIDKPDVRLVVHMDLPNSPEEYFQEAGRAGRDSVESYAVVLYNKTDITKLRKRVSDEFPDRDFITKVYGCLAYFLQVAEGSGINTVYDFDFHRFCSVYKLPLLPTHNALKILNLAGYVEYTEEIENRSRFIFTVYRDELYQYGFSEEYELLVNTILRLYTGVFTDYAYIDEANISLRTGLERKEIYEMLKNLSKRQIIDYIPYKKTPFIIYKQPRVDAKYLSIPRSVYEERKKRFKDRIDAIIDYATHEDICRSRLLLNYFAEKDTNDCNMCDACLAKAKKELTSDVFQEITFSLYSLLEKGELDINDIINQLTKAYDKENIIKVIRFQLDNGNLKLELNKLKLT